MNLKLIDEIIDNKTYVCIVSSNVNKVVAEPESTGMHSVPNMNTLTYLDEVKCRIIDRDDAFIKIIDDRYKKEYNEHLILISSIYKIRPAREETK